MIPLKSLVPIWVSVAITFPETHPKTVSKAKALFTNNPEYYLTQFLPKLGKLVDQALLDHHRPSFTSLTKVRKDNGLPVFMNEYFLLFFNEYGLRDDLSEVTLRRFRSLCYMFYKYELPFSDISLEIAKQKFIDTDTTVKTVFSEVDISLLKARFNSLLPDNPLDIRPRHSNGANASSFNNIQRRTTLRFIPSLHTTFGLDYFFTSKADIKRHLKEDNVLVTEVPSRVTFVPKDSRGPRTICMEPHERMYIQQGLMHKIYEHIEDYSSASGRINFTNQDTNRYLAYRSSFDGKYATLDLKDASDMVSNNLIMALCNDEWRAVLTATRSSYATLDDRSVLLKKYAPMGSALCFPIEAILFYCIAQTVTEDVYVYGDDIIVPNEKAQQVIEALEHYGLVVNRDKSCFTGHFRESCGFDAYRSHNVTPVRCRRLDLISAVAYANNLADAHGIEVAENFVRVYESITNTIVLRLTDHMNTSGAIALYNSRFSNLQLFKRRWNKNLQRYEFRVPCTRTSTKEPVPDGVLAYSDYLQSMVSSNSPIEDEMYPPDKVEHWFDRLVRKPLVRFSITRPSQGWSWVAYIT